MITTHFAKVVLAAAAMLLGPAPAAMAQGTPAPPAIDAHAVYERACSKCHFEHAADLARQKFALNGTRLEIARTGTPVDTLLSSHHGVSIDAPERAALLTLFANGITWAGTFQKRCASCHGTGRDFARGQLQLVNGEPVSRSSGAAVAHILTKHGEANATETAALLDMFRYQLQTAPAQ